MNRFVRVIQIYLVVGLPFMLACGIWGTVHGGEREILNQGSAVTRALWEVLSWNLMLWFAALITFLVAITVFPSVRERSLRRLANLKESDEREEQITGRASRAAYVSTLSVLILFLFVSVFTLRVARIPEAEAVDGKSKQISIALNFQLLDEPRVVAEGQEVLFESRDIPLSKTAILAILLAWQLASFNLSARREHLGVA